MKGGGRKEEEDWRHSTDQQAEKNSPAKHQTPNTDPARDTNQIDIEEIMIPKNLGHLAWR